MSDYDVEAYISRLASEHKSDQDEALAWLLDHPQESRAHLIELVKAGQPDSYTFGAIFLLGRMGEEEDVPLLNDILKRGDPQLHWGCAQALGSHASPAARDALLAALQHSSAEVIGAAAVALGRRGDESARKPLEQLLQHPKEPVRYRAVYALRELGSEPSAAVLRSHLKQETSKEVRKLINEVLGGNE